MLLHLFAHIFSIGTLNSKNENSVFIYTPSCCPNLYDSFVEHKDIFRNITRVVFFFVQWNSFVTKTV